jgi:hypothetical protein
VLTLISTILAGVLGFLPKLMGFFERKQELKYEIELTTLKLQAAKEGLTIQANTADLKSMVEEGNSLRTHDLGLTGNRFTQILSASVRPVITYAFFSLFFLVKLIMLFVLYDNGIVDPAVWKNNLLDDETMAIFGAIIGFWFGARAYQRLSEMYGAQSVTKGKK